MTDIFLSPHNDDETLFGSFTILRHKPHVVICFKSQVQQDRGGPTAKVREMETEGALWWLGEPSWSQGTILDSDPDPAEKLLGMMQQQEITYGPDRVWAPAFEPSGHNQHNLVSSAANAVWGDKVQPYLTYQRGSMRTRGTEVPFEPSWVVKKMRALCCYGSQIELENTRAWFMDDTLREYVP